jgi:DNA-binding GntR family transcriptional regulator
MADALSAIPRLSESGSLVGQIRDSLYHSITSGALDPGTRLREIPLSQHFGVSTTPVREALRRLESEGLVEVSPRRGAVVIALDASTVGDLYDLRLILESAAVKLAAKQGGELERIDKLIAEAEPYLDEKPEVTFHRIDLQLHRAINDLSGNAELAATAERVHRRIQAVRVRHAVPARLRVAHEQHKAIVEAIRARSVRQADKAIREHITSAKANVLGALREQGKDVE